MITFVVDGTAVRSGRSAMLRRARSIAAALPARSSSVNSIRTSVTPGSEPTRARTSRWISARSGQPAVVSATVTCTVPSGSTRAPFAIPSSTMSAPSSGSTTPRSSPTTSSTVGGACPSGRWEVGAGSVTTPILPAPAVFSQPRR
jgi:hypothetical protein